MLANLPFIPRALVIASITIGAACASKKDYEQSQADLTAQQAENVRLQAELDSLENLFAAEIEAKEIEMQLVRDGLEVYIPSDLVFRSGSAELGQSDQHKGREFGMKLAEYFKTVDYRISVIGNTDSQQPTGSLAQRYPTNWELAGARAAAVVRFFAGEGIDPTRMEAVSHGEYWPVESNSTAEGRARNRRVQIILRPNN